MKKKSLGPASRSRASAAARSLLMVLSPGKRDNGGPLTADGVSDEMAVVQAIARVVTSTLHIEQVYEKFAAEAKKLVDFDRIAISVIDHDTATFVPAYFSGVVWGGREPGTVTPLRGTVVERVLRRGRPLLREDIRSGESFVGDAARLEADLRSSLSVPLRNKGVISGILHVLSRRAGAFGLREQAVLERLADQVAPAVDNARLHSRLRDSTEEKAVVDEVARIITSTLDIDQVYEKFAAEVKKLLDFDQLGINLVDRAAGTFTPSYRVGVQSEGRAIGATVPLKGTLTERVIQGGQPYLREDISVGDRFPGDEARVRAGMRASLTVLLFSKARITGTLHVHSRRVGAFGPREQAILERLAAQIAPAVENAELYRRLRASAEEQAVLDEVARIITSTLEIGQVYEKFAAEVKKLVDFDRVIINVIDRDAGGFMPRYVSGVRWQGREPDAVVPLAGTVVERVLSTGQALLREDIRTSERFAGDSSRVQAGLRSALTLPMFSKGAIVGTLGVNSRRVGAFGPREQAILERLAALIAPAVENSELYRQLRSSAEEQAVLDEVARVMTSTLDTEQVYESFATSVKQLVDFDRIAVSTVDADAGTFSRKHFSGVRYEADEGQGGLPLEGSMTGKVFQTGQPVLREDTCVGDGYYGDSARFEAGLRSYLCVPLFGKGSVVGSLTVFSRQVSAYGQREQAVLGRLADQIAPAVENAEMYRATLEANERATGASARLQAVMDSVREGIIVFDEEGVVFMVNREAQEIWGYDQEQMVGEEVQFLMSPKHGEFLQDHLSQHSDSGVSEVIGKRLNLQGPKRGMTTFPLEVNVTRTEVGGRKGFVASVRDMTERKQAEEMMRETSRLASIGELSAGAAHELNNPLNSVLGFTQLLLQEDLPAAVHEDLQRVYSEGQRAAKVVENLLSFARKREAAKQRVSLAGIVERTLALKSYDLKAKNIEVRAQLPLDLPHTFADENQLVEVLLNILTNAEQAISEAGDGGRITIEGAATGHRVRISVSDDGPGIAPEHMGKIFDPFFTTKDVGKGTGLGLSMCYGVIRQHGGELRATSILGKGATFHIELPAHLPSDEHEPAMGADGVGVTAGRERRQHTPPSPPKDGRPETGACHILVVDDEPNIRENMDRLLSDDGHDIDSAEDGLQAWDKVWSKTYDCILLDLRMPRMSGQEFYRRIKERDESLARKVIFVTGDTFSAETREFLSTSGNPYLEKPIPAEELRKRIHGLREARHGQR